MATIFAQWLISVSIAILHPFFVSVIEIEHNPKDATAEISVRIFTDDLEKTLQKQSTGTIDIIKPTNKALIDQKISQYISKTLLLKINGKAVKLNYIGYEIIKESTWSYFEVTDIKEMNTVDINCAILHDFENSQINLFHVKSKGNQKSYKLDYPNKSTSFSF
ncbi:MAG: hypothetical protein B7Y11_00655 [Sphingobacteriia bacterium 24-36-13]|jgi:hypothetical protein|uniref:DUF6702 family protein n=1 Tax=Sediminibacterium sp. TaxID=1917865 RepID=UPI000BD1CCC8|nr:DUF6702 family protein [Sediminibacterium sp.]OYY10745.1 MAG: hypothetical protein B7Y66_04970 [Sphingobacteriia bacterium 35-36-14]OYZ55605.1 MAG: hypothetical protein B7Y11_00655 [Sphingobacteriia bacterium 24-36-13]OZA64656.1 MAG: hypothetical protein B7X68_06645 [Sphingobacteriia bacterium 39-36-14]HQS23322.1 hypothetical protein [Sediminibacterium sp.]HQS35483.1 hypothetical protein [Sediminibacterium sp.]